MKILLEHSSIPGTTYEESLICGSGGFVFNEMDFHESSNSGVCKFRGKFQEAGAVNKNKRIYPYEVLESNVKGLNEAIASGGLCGELDHPTDSIIHFANASHKVTKLWWEGKVLMGEGIILNTPAGKILKALINDDVRIGISSRGVGNGRVNEQGILVIGESYKLITFDAVADPSTNKAFQKRINANENILPQQIITNNFQDNFNKNDNTCINNRQQESNVASGVTKELLLAAIGGILKKDLNETRSRLS